MKIQAIIIFAIVVASFGSGYQVNHWRHQSNELARVQAEVEARKLMQELANDIAAQTLDQIANIRVENRNIYRDAVTEIREVPIYSECVLPVEAVRLINSARNTP